MKRGGRRGPACDGAHAYRSRYEAAAEAPASGRRLAAETRVSSESYQGLSDVEILDKLLQPDVFVVTDDGVPQMRAIEAGYRSDTLYQQGQLT